MRKSALIFVMALLTLPTNCIAQSNTTPPLSKSEGKPMYQTTKQHTRTPSVPVYVYQYERTLMFDEEHSGDTVIVTDGDNVIFTASLDADCSMEIPSDIVGEVMVLLECDGMEYYIYLEF